MAGRHEKSRSISRFALVQRGAGRIQWPPIGERGLSSVQGRKMRLQKFNRRRRSRLIVVPILFAGSLLLAGCASNHPVNKEVTVIEKADGVPHRGYYDATGLWHGGSYDSHHIYREDDLTWGQRHDSGWKQQFGKQ
jgi:hypothetical protein